MLTFKTMNISIWTRLKNLKYQTFYFMSWYELNDNILEHDRYHTIHNSIFNCDLAKVCLIQLDLWSFFYDNIV